MAKKKDQVIRPKPMTKEEAKEIAVDFITGQGIDEKRISLMSSNPSKEGWRFKFLYPDGVFIVDPKGFVTDENSCFS